MVIYFDRVGVFSGLNEAHTDEVTEDSDRVSRGGSGVRWNS